MSIPGAANPLLLATAAAGGYQISRSLRFNSSDSAFCSRTPASAGNRKTWTWAGWVKRTDQTTSVRTLFIGEGGTTNTTYARLILNQNKLYFGPYSGWWRITDQVFRDPSAWYHILLAVDTTQATANNRIRLYLNGAEITAFSTLTNPTQNDDTGINNNVFHGIGADSGGSYFDGYLADIHFIDGQALTPSSFTEVSATTGQLVPKAYSGSFGTNGFWLKFSDNSAATATTLGKDYSGNSNNWTPNNLSVTAGAGNDSLTDSPTSYGTGSGGGDVRGNFCTWNPLAKLGDITQTLNVSNGNLTFSGSSNIGTIGTIGMSSGKWYWELNCTSLTASQLYFGMTSVTTGSRTASFVGIRDTGVLSGSANGATTNGSGTTAFTTGDVVGFAYDADNKRLFVAKNNTWLNSADPAAGTNASFTDVQGSSLYPFISDNNTTATIDANWGARPFAYTAPSGFKALCDTNLPAPVVAKPSTVMDVKLYTGNGSTQTISGLGFNPDFVWIKSRGTSDDHCLVDAVRGTSAYLFSQSTAAEETSTIRVTSFNSDGFSLGSGAKVNRSSDPFVAWTWDAGSSTVTNTQGSITSQVRANASAGFSIVTYSGDGSTSGSVGHGLGVSPSMVIIKARNAAKDWKVAHVSLAAQNMISLNQTYAAGIASWDGVTSTVFKPARSGDTYNNSSGENYVAYCFAPVAGYSSFGSYTGNGSSDGPFVYTGFRPRFLLVKNISLSGTDWPIWDSARNAYNTANSNLWADLPSEEFTSTGSYAVDLLSNGFKLRNNTSDRNNSGNIFIYCAWAESPFQYARAR